MYWLESKYPQYTCAKWDKNTKTLNEAHINKFEFYAKRLWINKSSKWKTLLDLGCGWWWLIFYLNDKYWIKCTWMTLSDAQIVYINNEIKTKSKDDEIQVLHENVHNMTGKYDYIISVWLLEHIDDYDDLYKKTSLSLNKDGKALFHAMFNTEIFYKADEFLTTYIFPGGWTPNISSNIKIFKKYFDIVDRNDLPDLSYPKTLECRYNDFCKNEDKIRELLVTKSSCENIDYSINIFKHYLMLSYCWLSKWGIVSNILVYNK